MISSFNQLVSLKNLFNRIWKCNGEILWQRHVKFWITFLQRWGLTAYISSRQVSVTLENFQDISLPIPGKEDLAKLHSSTHQTSLVKSGSCGEVYAPQGWIAFVMEYIKRCVDNMDLVLAFLVDTVTFYLNSELCFYSQLVLGAGSYTPGLSCSFLCQRWTQR